VRLGLLTIDRLAAQHCFEALMTAPCDRLVDSTLRGPVGPRNAALPECAGAFVSHAQPGKTCRINEDCQDPEQYACVGDRGCGRVCTARTARQAGDVCSEGTDSCPSGTVCRYGADNLHDQRCLGPRLQGEGCREDRECASGLLCAQATATSILDGICRPLALGSPCAGNWECAYSYVCAGAGPNQAGTCQVGKPVGETCTTYLQSVNRLAYSDCAPGTYCLELDGTGPRCTDRAPLGARCGTQTGPYPGWVGCLEGYCARDPGSSPTVGTCEPTKLAGAACENDLECGRTNRCLPGADGGRRCGVPNVPAPLGSPCDFTVDVCGVGEYCALPASFDPNGPFVPSMGICAAFIRPGKPCRPQIDLCEGLAECVEGVCERCE
jgi:hypothetical protein